MRFHLPPQWFTLSRKWKTFLSVMAIYLSLTGIVTFSLFISYEAMKTSYFSTWPAQEAGDWEAVLRGVDVMRESIHLMRVMNNSLGWAQPLSFFAYRSLARAGDIYAHSLEARAFAHAPEIFNGRLITFTFRPESIVGGFYSTRRISVHPDFALVVGHSTRITGRVTVNPDETVLVKPP
jgi:hypothetical protein